MCFVIVVIMKTGGWYYKDRLGRTRGPMELIQLKTAWGGGIIDKDTFIWGDDMDEWAPIHMIYGMERAIATWEGLSCLDFAYVIVDFRVHCLQERKFEFKYFILVLASSND